MQITSKVIKKWKILKDHGDYKAIANTLPKYDYRAISLAFENKECSEEVYNAIDVFYNERIKRIQNA